MTPAELELIAADGVLVRADSDSFSRRFYDTLFEIAPATRALFPDDLVSQRGKLVNELDFLVDAATASRTQSDLSAFTDRARQLGRRHIGYGVTGADYAPLAVALIGAIRSTVPRWSPEHEVAWHTLIRLISDVMREGAEAGSGG